MRLMLEDLDFPVSLDGTGWGVRAEVDADGRVRALRIVGVTATDHVWLVCQDGRWRFSGDGFTSEVYDLTAGTLETFNAYDDTSDPHLTEFGPWWDQVLSTFRKHAARDAEEELWAEYRRLLDWRLLQLRNPPRESTWDRLRRRWRG